MKLQNLFMTAVLASLLSVNVDAQIITTVAGTGAVGFTGDGGPASMAKLSMPRGITFDNHGNLFIADDWNSRIRKVTVSGTISTVAGVMSAGGFGGDGGPATVAQLYGPPGSAVDTMGNIYIADYYNSRIRKVSTTGLITTFAGNGVMATTGDGGLATSASLYYPWGIATDLAGNVYVADQSSQRIRKINAATGIITTVAGTGTGGYSGDGGIATAAELNNPNGIYVSKSGYLFISDAGNHCIRKVTPSGVISTIAGTGVPGFSGDGGAATAALLNTPCGVVADTAGNVYIADMTNNRIRKVNAGGIISTVAGNGTASFSGDGGPATAAAINQPYCVAVDGAGNLYIGDSYNNRIRKVALAGTGTENINSPSASITLYPMPAQKVLTITSTEKITGISITNLVGQMVYTNTFDARNVKIDVSNFPVGEYLVNINGTDVRKLVKE